MVIHFFNLPSENGPLNSIPLRMSDELADVRPFPNCGVKGQPIAYVFL